jgi:ABC-type lipoprotein release transport system permease subunit
MGNSNSNSIGRIIVFVMLGLIFGGILGESLGWLFGYLGTVMNAGGEDNVVHNFFVKALEFKVGYSKEGLPILVDLYMIKFHLGFTFMLNIVSIIGVAVALYMMKWSGNR